MNQVSTDVLRSGNPMGLRTLLTHPKIFILFVFLVLVILEVIFRAFGWYVAPKVWMSKEDKICQRADYWYATREEREFRLSRFNSSSFEHMCGSWRIFR